MENFAKEWVEYPFLAMLANANSIANTQCERTLNPNFIQNWTHYICKNKYIVLTATTKVIASRKLIRNPSTP